MLSPAKQLEQHEVLNWLRQRAEQPDMSRSQLARELCERMDWRDARGRLQEMGARKRLGVLHREGLIDLPRARRMVAQCESEAPQVALNEVRCSLAELGQIELICVTGNDARHRGIWRALMQHHPLGGGPLCGAQLRYLVRCERGWLAALAFSACAYRLKARDRYLGWSESERRTHLQRVVCNSRFLILPQVQVPHLASHLLSQLSKRLGDDWLARYGYAPWAVETYVDSAYQGTCYRAANWVEVGHSAGRGRQDRHHRREGRAKRVFVYLLSPERFARRQRPLPEAQDWVEREFAHCALEPRLKRRAHEITRLFSARPMASTPQACQTWAQTKAAYRFFANPKTNMQSVLDSHYQATVQRCAEHSLVLAVCDSSALNYSAHPMTERLGPIGAQANGPIGLWIHGTMSFTPSGLPLGLIDMQCWARDKQQFGKKHRRYQLPIEEKESQKWLTSYNATIEAQAACPNTQFVMIGDRESDVYELFAHSRGQRAQLLVRAQQRRKLSDEQAHLWTHMQAQPVAGEVEVSTHRKPDQPVRQATLAVRYAKVSLKPPSKRAHLGQITLWAIWAHETHPPAGEQPLSWMLLTSVPTINFEQASERLDWYAKRWGIEIYHRVLKSGCQIEERQLGNADRLETALAFDMIVAWRVMHLVHLNREVPDLPATVYFSLEQCQALIALTSRNPKACDHVPTLNEFVHLLAKRLGGHMGRKSDGEPGAEKLWRALQRLDDITEMYTITSMPDPPT